MSPSVIVPPYNLLTLYQHRAINHVSGFCDLTGQLDAHELAAAYHRTRDGAPRRHSTGKQYFVGHTGYPGGRPNQVRCEEHLAIALWNSEQPLRLPRSQNVALLDYQFPLKSRQADKGVGKVDLFGVVDEVMPCVIELKIHPTGNGLSDTPLRAFLEALAYCAIVEANADDIAREALEKFGHEFTQARPVLMVMAPEEYWKGFLNHPKAGQWWPALRSFTDQMNNTMGLQSLFIALRGTEFTMGSSELKPQLSGQCSLLDLADLVH